ncbi:MAG: hypothetical protein ACPHRO_05270, partial [Nannocystaceae bacterium]
MTRVHTSSPHDWLRSRLARALAIPTMLVLGIPSAHAEETLGGVPYVRCADGTVVFSSGTTGPFNPNDPSADPCAGHGGAAGLNDPAQAIPLDASA